MRVLVRCDQLYFSCTQITEFFDNHYGRLPAISYFLHGDSDQAKVASGNAALGFMFPVVSLVQSYGRIH